MRFKHVIQSLLLTISLVLGVVSCSDTDCPLSSVVRCYYTLYSSETGQILTYQDTLSVFAADTTLLNQAVRTSSFDIPMSYNLNADTLTFQFKNPLGITYFQVIVTHTNKVNFTSLDCGVSYFHTITGITHSTGITYPNIDSIVVVKPEVNYDKIENIRIYLSHL